MLRVLPPSLVLALLVVPATAQWMPSSGITGGHVLTSICLHGDKVLLGTESGGLYQSSDASSWSPVRGGLPSGEVTCIRSIYGALYAGVLDSGTWRSGDGGVTWSPLPLGNDNRSLFAAAGSGGVVFLTNGEFVRSDDSGSTYQVVLHFFVSAIAAYGPALYAGGLTMWRSTDGGESWDWAAGLTETYTPVNAIVARGRNVLAIAHRVRHRSADSGRTFTLDSAEGLLINDVSHGVLDDLLASEQGLLRTSDGGATFDRIGPPVEMRSVSRSGSSVAAATPKSVGLSTDGGVTWSWHTPRIMAQPVAALDVAGSEVVAFSDDAFRSTDGGLTFDSVGSEGLYGQVIRAVHGGDYRYVTTWDTTEEVVRFYRQPLAGGAWQNLTDALADDLAMILYARGDLLLAGSWAWGNIHRSTDGGASWNKVAGNSSLGLVRPVGFAEFNGSIYYAMGHAMARSTDDGMTWSEVDLPPVSQITAIASSGSAIVYSAGFTFRSTDGITFTQVDSETHRVTRLLADGSVLYAGTSEEGVVVSADGGQTWRQLAPGLEGPAVAINDLAVAGGRLLAATGSNVWLVPLWPGAVESLDDRPTPPLTIRLEGTVLRFSRAVRSQVEVVTPIGVRLWRGYVDDRMPLPDLASGVYLLRTAEGASARFVICR